MEASWPEQLRAAQTRQVLVHAASLAAGVRRVVTCLANITSSRHQRSPQSRAVVEEDGGRRKGSRAGAAAGTGGWRAGSLAVLAVAKWLEGDGGRTGAVGAELAVVPRAGGEVGGFQHPCQAQACLNPCPPPATPAVPSTPAPSPSVAPVPAPPPAPVHGLAASPCTSVGPRQSPPAAPAPTLCPLFAPSSPPPASTPPPGPRSGCPAPDGSSIWSSMAPGSGSLSLTWYHAFDSDSLDPRRCDVVDPMLPRDRRCGCSAFPSDALCSAFPPTKTQASLRPGLLWLRGLPWLVDPRLPVEGRTIPLGHGLASFCVESVHRVPGIHGIQGCLLESRDKGGSDTEARAVHPSVTRGRADMRHDIGVCTSVRPVHATAVACRLAMSNQLVVMSGATVDLVRVGYKGAWWSPTRAPR